LPSAEWRHAHADRRARGARAGPPDPGPSAEGRRAMGTRHRTLSSRAEHRHGDARKCHGHHHSLVVELSTVGASGLQTRLQIPEEEPTARHRRAGGARRGTGHRPAELSLCGEVHNLSRQFLVSPVRASMRPHPAGSTSLVGLRDNSPSLACFSVNPMNNRGTAKSAAPARAHRPAGGVQSGVGRHPLQHRRGTS
jgi:hypothetical protein